MPAERTDLAPMDQVSFWIGRVSRVDTNIEAMLHLFYEMLDGSDQVPCRG